MITAIVMINCQTRKVHSVSEALVDLDGVAEYSISGEYDIMAILRVKEYESLSDVVSEQVPVSRASPGPTRVAFRCYSKHDMEKMWSTTWANEQGMSPLGSHFGAKRQGSLL
jgi:DNA-binding Lrp family transcriptional regulator